MSPTTLRRTLILLSVVTIAFPGWREGQAGSSRGTTSASQSSIQGALARLFEQVRKDDFEAIYTNDEIWANRVLKTKALPAFQQERELSSYRQRAEEEYYADVRYAPVAAYALREPKIEFLESRSNGWHTLLYYKLTFSSPDLSPRQNNSSFIRERIVRLELDDNGRFWQLATEIDYDVLWETFPQRIEWVEISRVAGDRVEVKASYTSHKIDVKGTVTIGNSTKPLYRLYSDPVAPKIEPVVAGFDPDETPELIPGRPIEVLTSLEFSDGARDKVRFKAQAPSGSETLRAVEAQTPLSAFELKAKKYQPKFVDTIVVFEREPRPQGAAVSP